MGNIESFPIGDPVWIADPPVCRLSFSLLCRAARPISSNPSPCRASQSSNPARPLRKKLPVDGKIGGTTFFAQEDSSGIIDRSAEIQLFGVLFTLPFGYQWAPPLAERENALARTVRTTNAPHETTPFETDKMGQSALGKLPRIPIVLIPFCVSQNLRIGISRA